MAKPKSNAVKPRTDAEDPILPISAVAKMFGKHRNTVARWISDGLLKPQRLPVGIGVRQSEVLKFLGASALAPPQGKTELQTA